MSHLVANWLPIGWIKLCQVIIGTVGISTYGEKMNQVPCEQTF